MLDCRSHSTAAMATLSRSFVFILSSVSNSPVYTMVWLTTQQSFNSYKRRTTVSIQITGCCCQYAFKIRGFNSLPLMMVWPITKCSIKNNVFEITSLPFGILQKNRNRKSSFERRKSEFYIWTKSNSPNYTH